eukprot:CAMPEP_0194390252 /NCGR_PEP_ID=MMETSP0174-20130528/108917_1 /TAXON_ID=216777 /ORGANISM="Proboscia alata, Strain PI-D3" /LENGTH=54 /DNA_ID=CAMNT_0039183403 /DNA_START=289 /DNA_END=450 /DNA_ORIENTATION=-
MKSDSSYIPKSAQVKLTFHMSKIAGQFPGFNPISEETDSILRDFSLRIPDSDYV